MRFVVQHQTFANSWTDSEAYPTIGSGANADIVQRAVNSHFLGAHSRPADSRPFYVSLNYNERKVKTNPRFPIFLSIPQHKVRNVQPGPPLCRFSHIRLWGRGMPRLARLSIPILSLAIGAALVGLPGGCSRTTAAAPATVRGKVMFQGAPLAGGLIVFSPDPERGGSGKPARGDLANDGTFQLMLADATAIPPGWYRVAIAPAPLSAHPDAIFPPQLARPDRSGIVREVKAGQENVFEFTVEVSSRN